MSKTGEDLAGAAIERVCIGAEQGSLPKPLAVECRRRWVAVLDVGAPMAIPHVSRFQGTTISIAAGCAGIHSQVTKEAQDQHQGR